MSVKLVRILLAACASLAVLAAPAVAATPEYFPLAENRPLGEGLAIAPDGDVWFGGGMLGAETVPPLGRLVPAAASAGTSNGISLFPTPTVGEGCCANFIRDVGFDAANGRVWFIRSTGAIGFGLVSAMNPGTSMGQSAVKVPGGVDLGGLAVAANGTVWFTERGATSSPNFYGNRAASTDNSLAISELPDLGHYENGSFVETRWDAGPKGITIDGAGNPWFVEEDTGNPGYRLAKIIGGTYQEHLLQPCQPTAPCSGSFTGTGPVSVTAALDGTIWFTNLLKNTFGKFDPLTEEMTQYSLTTVNSQLAGGEPRSIRAAPDGSLWLAEWGFISHPNANALVRIVPSDPPTATVYQLGGAQAPLGVVPDSNGNVWFGAHGVPSPDSIGRLSEVVGPPPSPLTPKSEALPPPGAVVVKPTTAAIAKTGEVLVHGTDIWAKQICVGPPEDRCSLIYLLDSHEYVSGFPGTKPRLAATSGGRRTRTVVIGRKAVTVAGGKTATVKIKLNAKGKGILKRDGVLHLTFHASQKLAKGKKKVLATKKLTIRDPAPG